MESLPPWDAYELQTADLHANTEANRQRKELSRLDQTRGSTQTIQASEGNNLKQISNQTMTKTMTTPL
ncbi:hypothetical protein GcC1_008020 [Golovinomyces cichoracearum]|uniref:Uncharacterized protein n=1 Tax=Golovinomyces cichoracearum TaxID=62708 RepID=A0A420J875_9PEZI|nr:hypothetical protein GcC1_008020 [Golovinomyces cichoracearum]